MLEKRTYTIQELSKIVNSSGKQAIDRKLASYKIVYTSKGRGDKLTYTITDIRDRFKVFCIFDLGFDPHTDFTKLRDFLFYLLGDDDFSWRPMEMMEEYLRIEGKGISRQTISKYIKRLEEHKLFSRSRTDFIYYRVYHEFGVQKHELVDKKEYSKAWGIYWDLRKKEYHSSVAYSIMYSSFGGVPRKQGKLEGCAFCKDTYNLLTELVAESILLEVESQLR